MKKGDVVLVKFLIAHIERLSVFVTKEREQRFVEAYAEYERLRT